MTAASSNGRTPNVTSCQFLDIDHFREHLRGWDTPAIQIEPGQLAIRLHSIDLDGVIFSDIRVNRKVIDHSRPGPDWLKCVVNLTPAVFCGIEVGAGHLTVMAPGREYSSFLSDSWYSIEIVVSASVLAEEGLWVAPHLLSGPEDAAIALPAELVGVFRRLTEATFDRDRRVDAARLRCALLRNLDRALRIGARERPAPQDLRTTNGYDLTRRMIRYIESRFGCRVTVNEIANELGVTPRALNYAARSTLGMSPLDLVLAFRLNQVRNELWETRFSEPSITTSALKQDFGHLGRFSEHYRELFGELPSQTLHRIQHLGRT